MKALFNEPTFLFFLILAIGVFVSISGAIGNETPAPLRMPAAIPVKVDRFYDMDNHVICYFTTSSPPLLSCINQVVCNEHR